MSANRRPETLGDFVRRIRKDKHLSLADVSRQSGRSGSRISASGINRIENDPKHRTTANKLTALANGLGIPAGELFARAVGAVPGNPGDELELITRFRELPPERQADVLRIVDMWYSEQIKCGDAP